MIINHIGYYLQWKKSQTTNLELMIFVFQKKKKYVLQTKWLKLSKIVYKDIVNCFKNVFNEIDLLTFII